MKVSSILDIGKSCVEIGFIEEGLLKDFNWKDYFVFDETTASMN